MEKMIYENFVRLAGYVGEDVIWKKAKNAKRYCSFQVITNNDYKSYESDIETESRNYIRIIVFNNRTKRLVEKLEKAGLKRGLKIKLEGKLQTSKSEIKGNIIIQLTVYPHVIWLTDKHGNETEIK